MAQTDFFPSKDQPFKALAIVASLGSILLKLPWWTLFYSSRSRRPRSSWSLKMCLMVEATREATRMLDKIGPLGALANPTHRVLWEEGEKGIWIEPNVSLFQGQVKYWAHNAGIEPIRIPGYWWHSPSAPSDLTIGSTPRPDEKVLLILHGGGFTVGTAYPAGTMVPLYMGIMEATKSIHRGLAVEYRLSSAAPFKIANPFPAAILDAVAGYNHLITVAGFLPENVIISGDSAGGLLAIGLLRYLAETNILQTPGGFLGLSSTCDISRSHLSNPDSSLLSAPDGIGLLNEGFLGWGLKAFAGSLHESLEDGPELNPYFGPASIHPAMEDKVSFKGFPRTFLSYGGAERLRDPNRVLGRRMKRDLGEDKVTILESADAIHDFITSVWYEPARSEALLAIGSWVDNLA